MGPTDEEIAELNAEIGRQRRPKWRVAVEADVNPVRFYAMLARRLPMPAKVYEHTCQALRIVKGNPSA